MASLIRQSGEDPGDIIELKPGVNRFGTGENCDFIVDHSSVSSEHCDLVVDEAGITVRSLDPGKATFVDDRPVTQWHARVGQTIRMGEVRLLVADDQLPDAAAGSHSQTPAVRYCAKHPGIEVSFHCPHCDLWMCIHCVHVLKVHHGHGLCLCPKCSNRCESLLTKNTRELGQVIDQLVMVRNAFGPRSHGSSSAPST
jgi:transcription elongation factor Elf1